MGAWYDPFGITDSVNSLLHPEKGYEDASKQINKFWDQAQSNLQPYNQAGIGQLPNLQNASNALLDPAKLESQWTQGYSESPYAQQLQKEATAGGMDAASQQGLLGSSAALNNVQTSSANIMNADRQQYLNDLMQKYMTGIGTSQGLYNAGAGAAGGLSQGALQTGANLGNLAYGKANAPGNMLAQLLGFGASAGAKSFMGGM